MGTLSSAVDMLLQLPAACVSVKVMGQQQKDIKLHASAQEQTHYMRLYNDTLSPQCCAFVPLTQAQFGSVVTLHCLGVLCRRAHLHGAQRERGGVCSSAIRT
jgi:hypothetical protein